MLELNRSYTKAEMSAILHSKTRASIQRKLSRYGVIFVASGRGEQVNFKVIGIKHPFKLFAMLDLGFDANTDFQKLAIFFYYYFNDDEFMAMPDEVKEARMRASGHPISRQTIAKYTERLVQENMISRQSDDYIYYFAHKQFQTMTNRQTYSQAWKEYWAAVNSGVSSAEAIYDMKIKYGGVARKQARPAVNGIYNKEIETIRNLVITVIDP